MKSFFLFAVLAATVSLVGCQPEEQTPLDLHFAESLESASNEELADLAVMTKSNLFSEAVTQIKTAAEMADESGVVATATVAEIKRSMTRALRAETARRK